jgi:hypothetical protein
MSIRQNRIGRSARILAMTLTAAVLLAASVAAANFVSLNGKFYITYPDNWHQVDFTTVDYYLSQNQPSSQTFQYEGVFAENSDHPFYAGNYLILTVDTVGNLTAKQRDSVMADLGGEPGQPPKTMSLDEFFETAQADVPVYDPATNMAAVLSDIRQPAQPVKKGLLVLKFYDRGIANFYFYSPDSLYDSAAPIFRKILASFSTENLQAAMPKESLKIASSEKMKSESSEAGKNRTSMIIIWSIAIVLIVAYVVHRKIKSGKTIRL